MLDIVWIILEHLLSASVVFIFGVDQIYSVRDIVVVRFWRLALKLPIQYSCGYFRMRIRRINGKSTSWVETTQIFGFVASICPFNNQLSKALLLE